MAERIIVTGAAGFIGSHLCEALLARGYLVVGVDSFNDNYDARIKRRNLGGIIGTDRFSLIEGNLVDTDLSEILGEAAVVFHLAAQPGVRQSWRERFDDYIDANVRSTHRLCDACQQLPIRRFVYASSSSVYGETTTLPMSEDHPTRPHSPYGVTKLAGEALCLLYRRNYGLPVVALRFFTVFGPRQRPDMAFHRFIKNAIEGRPVEVYGSGAQTRDWTYVGDIVDANLLAMEYDGSESVFNIGGGTRTTLKAAIDIVANELRDPMDIRYVDPVKGDVFHTYADIDLARKELGYSPRVDLEEGVEREVEWIRAIGNELGVY